MPLKSVLITGCSAGGIGAAIALVLAREGHHVFATARNTSKIPQELTQLSNVIILSLDITSKESITAAAQSVIQSGHGLDVLVNNAGAGYVMPVLDWDIERVQALYDTNVWGSVRTIQAFADLLISSRGRILNVSSMGCMMNMPWLSAYTSSKIALTQISETLRLELSPFGVTVVTVMAGVVESNFGVSDFELPSGSYYADIEDVISGWSAVKGQKSKGVSAEEFAKSLVGDIVGNGNNKAAASGGKVWPGSFSVVAKWMVWLMPTFVIDMLVSRNQGLDILAEKMAVRREG